ncbi:MAG TPA: chemotaxis protein CheD [Clostridia bacterium]|nr:chemotaxis protein CheD [Clostridia bacterium]
MSYTIVGIAEMAIAKSPETITTLGLGSCVGIVLYDRIHKIGGLAHVLLPNAPKGDSVNIAKYADTAVDELVRRMTLFGANPRLMTAKLAGGAHMFGTTEQSDVMQVGKRNVEFSKTALIKNCIAIIAEDVGGTNGRTIVLNCETGSLTVRTAWPRTEKNI